MSGGGDRRPLIVLLCLALAAVALFATGAFGAAGKPDTGTSPSWFSGFSLGGRLRPDALVVRAGACSVSGATITFTGGCELEITPVEGGFPWTDATRRAKLVAGEAPVAVALTVQERALTTTLDPGEAVRLVFTRDAGRLALGCLGLGSCTATLAEDSGP